MGRTNKTLQGAFTLIAGTASERSAVEQFITRNASAADPGLEYSLANSPAEPAAQYSLAKFLDEYKSEYSKQSFTIELLAQLETIIMQIKARTDMTDVVVYFNKSKYIYARCPFYRSDRDIKEIRVIISPILKYFKDGPTKENLESLNNNKEFMDIVYGKIADVMDTEIDESIRNYNILKNNLEYSN